MYGEASISEFMKGALEAFDNGINNIVNGAGRVAGAGVTLAVGATGALIGGAASAVGISGEKSGGMSGGVEAPRETVANSQEASLEVNNPVAHLSREVQESVEAIRGGGISLEVADAGAAHNVLPGSTPAGMKAPAVAVDQQSFQLSPS